MTTATPAPSPHAFVVNGAVFFDPHPGKQCEVLDILRGRVFGSGPAPVNVFLRGNRGSGKSRLVRAFLHACAMASPGFKYVVVRRNMPDLRQNHLIYVGTEMRKLGGTFHETFGQAHYDNGSIGFYRQCEDEKDAEKIVGAEAAVLFVDEAPQIKWELLRMLGPSLRVPAAADGSRPYRTMVIYGGNPTGESIEELDRYFLDKDVEEWDDPEYVPDDFLLVDIHRKDNPSIDEQEYRKQFAGLAPHLRKAWLDGERMESRTLFGVHKTIDKAILTKLGDTERAAPLPESWLGRPYHYIQELPKVSGVPLLKVPWIQVYRTYDHGFFPDPATCIWIAILGRRIIAFHEETWVKTIAKDIAAKMIEVTKELVGTDDAGDPRIPVAMTTVDPAIDVQDGRVTVMDDLETGGVPCEASINDRVLYADAIHGLLGEEIEPGLPRFQIYEPGCPMLAKYLPKMRWDEKNPRKMADHKFDHWPVALAYFAISSGVLSSTAKDSPAVEPAWMQWMREDSGGSRRRRTH